MLLFVYDVLLVTVYVLSLSWFLLWFWWFGIAWWFMLLHGFLAMRLLVVWVCASGLCVLWCGDCFMLFCRALWCFGLFVLWLGCLRWFLFNSVGYFRWAIDVVNFWLEVLCLWDYIGYLCCGVAVYDWLWC